MSASTSRETSPEPLGRHPILDLGELTPRTREVAETLVSMADTEKAQQALETLRLQQQQLQLEREREQREHEIKMAELKAQHERERLEIQREHLQLERERLQLRENFGADHQRSSRDDPKLCKYEEGEDIDVYLRTFEMVMSSNSIAPEQWVAKLAPKLSGRAREAYSRLTSDQAMDYDQVKKAILRRYELTAEAYRKKFRNTRRQDDTFAEWSVKLTMFLE